MAEILSGRGYDVVSAIEKRKHGLSDHEQLEFALREGRALVTHNIRDFTRLHSLFFERHYGIIVSNQESLAVLLKRLLYFLSKETVDSVKGRLLWLSNFDPPRDL